MQPLSVVVFQSDPGIVRALASAFNSHFPSVHVARSSVELRTAIQKHRAGVVVVDIELSQLSEVEKLHHEFPATSIVCTHRLADEEMWAAALAAGADDFWPSWDTRGILTSVLRGARVMKSSTAAA